MTNVLLIFLLFLFCISDKLLSYLFLYMFFFKEKKLQDFERERDLK